MRLTGALCAIVKAFDSGVVDTGTKRLVRARTTRALDLLELRGRAAMRAGTVAAIAAGDHLLGQAWSRHFYEDPDGIYGASDGLHYLSAHNGDRAVSLYERAADALAVRQATIRRCAPGGAGERAADRAQPRAARCPVADARPRRVRKDDLVANRHVPKPAILGGRRPRLAPDR